MITNTKPCNKCGGKDRNNSGECRSCVRERSARYCANVKNRERRREQGIKWRAENPERMRQNTRKWREKNPERQSQNSARYYTENSEKIRQRSAKWYAENIERARQTQTKWSSKNAGKRKISARKRYLRRTYNLTPEEYNVMLTEQKGLCRICEDRPATAIDHCHTSGQIRGILCSPCNTALGGFQDSVSILRQAANYLVQSRRRLLNSNKSSGSTGRASLKDIVEAEFVEIRELLKNGEK